MLDRDRLHHDGYALLRQAIPAAWLEALRDAFDQGVTPSAEWPVPRGPDWRHALVDLDPTVMAACRLPLLLSAVGLLIGERFFLSQVEGREPLPGGGYQGLHRDFSARRPGDTVSALLFLDDYGPGNGATRFVPATHRLAPDALPTDLAHGADGLLQPEGTAGDILVFDADLLHAASRNASGARRRSLLAGYRAEPLHAQHQQSARLRGVRMDTRERFDPPPVGDAAG